MRPPMVEYPRNMVYLLRVFGKLQGQIIILGPVAGRIQPTHCGKQFTSDHKKMHEMIMAVQELAVKGALVQGIQMPTLQVDQAFIAVEHLCILRIDGTDHLVQGIWG